MNNVDDDEEDGKVLTHHELPTENEWYHSSLLLLPDIVGSGTSRLSFVSVNRKSIVVNL